MPASDQENPRHGLSLARRLGGAVLLLASLAASAMLALHHLWGLSLPRCGPNSDCDALTSGLLGSVGGWPTAYVGAAYFAGLLLAWLIAPRTGFPRTGKWLVRAGLLVSLFFVGAMFVEGKWCEYCLAVHAGNVCFWALAELTPAASGGRRAAAAFAAAGILVTSALALGDHLLRQSVDRQGEAELAASIQQIIEQARKPRSASANDRPPFTGRYRKGPAQAAIRIVIFTDYQCSRCQALDAQIAQAIRGRSDVSFSIKHFPLCRECNPMITNPRQNVGSCRAARVAEAAGLLGGGEAFWFMHAWLMGRGGEFTDEQLAEELASLGLIDRAKFQAVLASQQIKDRVRGDVDEAIALGAPSTPTMFVNGVVVHGLHVPGATSRLLDALAKESLPALTAASDRPPTKADLLLADWPKQPAIDIPRNAARWTLGPASAPLRVTLFADCLSPNAALAARSVLDAATGRTDVRIEWFHFPEAGKNYEAARLLEAAGRTGGVDGFWSMHAWLLANGAETRTSDVLAAAKSLKLDRKRLVEEAVSQGVREAIEADVSVGVSIQVRQAPTIFINGRRVSEQRPSRELLKRIFALELERAGKHGER
jgi:protein-disulfide isomerase/uncharacterized membrane protein